MPCCGRLEQLELEEAALCNPGTGMAQQEASSSPLVQAARAAEATIGPAPPVSQSSSLPFMGCLFFVAEDVAASQAEYPTSGRSTALRPECCGA